MGLTQVLGLPVRSRTESPLSKDYPILNNYPLPDSISPITTINSQRLALIEGEC